VVRDQPAAVGDRLDHGERAGDLDLRNQFGSAKTQLKRRGLELVGVPRPTNTRACRAHGALQENRIVGNVGNIFGTQDQGGPWLRHSGGFESVIGRNLVLHAREALERRHDGREPKMRQPCREHRHLLLGRKQQIDAALCGDPLRSREPSKRIAPEPRHVVNGLHVASETRQADAR